MAEWGKMYSNQFSRSRMKKRFDNIAVGDNVYIVPTDNRYKPFCANIIRIGTKYITIDTIHYTENRFDKLTGLNTTLRYELFASKQHYEDVVKANKKAEELYKFCYKNLVSLNYEQLCKIEATIKSML